MSRHTEPAGVLVTIKRMSYLSTIVEMSSATFTSGNNLTISVDADSDEEFSRNEGRRPAIVKSVFKGSPLHFSHKLTSK
jgi:hypothetical protein